MTISKTWLNLSLLAGILMAAVSAAGIFSVSVYSQEHVSWAAQGYGQDIINLFLVFPALLVCLYLIKKGFPKVILVWLGVLVYMAYSYILYAFFMHFGSWFLVYITILGLSFYALMGSVIELRNQVPNNLTSKTKGASIYLFVNGLMFGVLWMMEIIPSILNGHVPKSATDVGLWINPVHVLDLAFLLPAMLIVATLLWKRKPMGFLLSTPLIVFAILMATAIVSMVAVMNARRITDTMGSALLMTINALIGSYLTYRFLKYPKV